MTIEELEQIAKSVCQENDKYDFSVNVCMDLACMSQGADRLLSLGIREQIAHGTFLPSVMASPATSK